MPLFNDIGIDLGTANTICYLRGKGIVLREPSVVAINTQTRSVLAVGNEAKEMIGRTPGSVVAIRPLKEGVIADFTITQNMLSRFIKKVCRTTIIKPRVLICIPSGVTEVEKRAIQEATMQSGAKQTFLMEEPMAAAIGAGLPVQEPVGSMIVDIGGGTTEVAVISLGGIVKSISLRVAGDNVDEAIIQYIKRKHNILLGDRSAEDIKINMSDISVPISEQTVEVCGRNLVSGLPKTITVSADEIFEAISEQLLAIIDAIKATLELTPPELSADIMQSGITIAGGGALLKNLDKMIKHETGLEVKIADNPMDCVARGTGLALEHMDKMAELFVGK